MPEIRKVQMTGGSTFIISLPKQWVNSMGLKKGDDLIFENNEDGSLSLSANLNRDQMKIVKQMEIHQKIDPEALLRELIGCYVTGYDVIEIQTKEKISSEVRKVIQEFTRRTIGPEIIEESSGLIVIQDVADHSDLAMKKIVRRMHIMTRNMLEESLRALKEMDGDLSKTLIARDDDIDRLYWFVEKQHAMIGRNPSFAQKIKTSWLESNVLLSTARALERIADHATRIAHSVALLKSSKISEDVMKKLELLSANAISLLDGSIDALFKKDAALANDCIDSASQLRNKTNAFLEDIMKQKGKIAVGLTFIAESIDRTGGYSADIAENAINISV